MAVIFTINGGETWVNEEDYLWAKNQVWQMLPGKNRSFRVYLNQKNRRKDTLISMSRMIAERMYGPIPNTVLIDHRNCITIDNRRCNLRLATKHLNNRNRASCSTKMSGLPVGVYRGWKPGKFKVEIRVNGKLIRLGTYDSIQVASDIRELINKKLEIREEAIALERVRLYQETLARKGGRDESRHEGDSGEKAGAFASGYGLCV